MSANAGDPELDNLITARQRLPDDARIPEDERRQLAYQLSRRAWRDHSRGAQTAERLMAQVTGWNAAMAHVRAGRGIIDADDAA